MPRRAVRKPKAKKCPGGPVHMPRRAVHKTKQNACGEVRITGLPAPGPGPGSAYSRLLDSSTTDYGLRSPIPGPTAMRCPGVCL